MSMVAIEILVLVAAVVLIAAVFALKRWATGETSSKERVTVEETANITHYFTRKHATITFPDGSEKSVVYDERSDKENRVILLRYSEDCFTVRPKYRSGSPMLKKQSVLEEDTRMFSLSNIRGIDIDRTDEMVAVAEVEVEREEEVREDGSRFTQYTSFNRRGDYEVSIWWKGEWLAHIENGE